EFTLFKSLLLNHLTFQGVSSTPTQIRTHREDQFLWTMAVMDSSSVTGSGQSNLEEETKVVSPGSLGSRP
ncbi:hypothetical protein RRG08_028999, partial [Elysia crispata]